MAGFNRSGLLTLGTACVALCTTAVPTEVRAQGDLLVAPTRVVLNGGGGAQVILSNIGETTATYRISLELRRMTSEGDLDPVDEAATTEAEQAALAMVRYAPRRITLQPNQPQAVRISARPGAELPDGEYRVHLMFRAIPDPTIAAKAIEQPSTEGLAIRLIPIYGLTIPLIVRKGQLTATAALANPRLQRRGDASFFEVDLQRSGDRSIYGDITVSPRGGGKPIYTARGFAVYPELTSRTVSLQLAPEEAALFHGPLHLEYREPQEAGGKLIAAMDATLP
jgi:P pilus assembly chaperone PapD